MKVFLIIVGTVLPLLLYGGGDPNRVKDALKRVLSEPQVDFLAPDELKKPLLIAEQALDEEGSDDQIRFALAEILGDPKEASLWIRALRRSQMSGVPSETLTDWVREHLGWVLSQNDLTLSQALSVLKTYAKPSDADMLKRAAAGLPEANTSRKDALLIVAADIPFLVTQREQGMARARELEEKAAAGDRSPEVLLWIERRDEKIAQLEGRRKYKQQLEMKGELRDQQAAPTAPLGGPAPPSAGTARNGSSEHDSPGREVRSGDPHISLPVLAIWTGVLAAAIGLLWLALKKRA